MNNMNEGEFIYIFGIVTCVIFAAIFGWAAYDEYTRAENFGLGSVVITTSEYEYLTNDSFTGVVVRDEGWSDPALTIRNREGEERRIATEFLEPVV